MAYEALNSADSSPGGRFRFTVRGMMILVLGAAVACAQARVEKSQWVDAALAALATWAVFGLVHQIEDLWMAFRARSDLVSDERDGYRFMIGWRCAVILLIAGNFALQALQSLGYVSIDEGNTAFLFVPSVAARKALLCLLLMILVWQTPRMQWGVHVRSNTRWWAQFVCAAASAALCILLWWRPLWIHFLVHVACDGITNAQPLKFAPRDADYDLTRRYGTFIAQALIATALPLFNLLVIRYLAMNWPRKRSRRCLIGFLLAGLIASVAATAWLIGIAIRRVSPFLVLGLQLEPLHRWLPAGVAVLVPSVAIAARLARSPQPAEPWSHLAWRRVAGRYYHEWRSWQLLLAAAAIVGIVGEVVSFARWSAGTEWLEDSLEYPLNAMYAAVALLAGRAAFAGVRRSTHAVSPEVVGISRRRFWLFFPALLITLTCLVPGLAALTFSLWLTRWYALPV